MPAAESELARGSASNSRRLFVINFCFELNLAAEQINL